MAEAERTIILVKAHPQPSATYGETVCCAGVTTTGEWRRLFPIRFRFLTGEARFSRWDIVDYRARRTTKDPRRESRRVEEDSLSITGHLSKDERAGFFEHLVRSSLDEARSRGESLALVRPSSVSFRWKPKSPAEMAGEREKARKALAQRSMLDPDLPELQVCPFHLRLLFEAGGRRHGMACGDWETTTTYWKWSRQYGGVEALELLKQRYEKEYQRDGVVLALGTVARRPRQWLLLGVIKLEETDQLRLL